jgi:hypothetical protein
VSDNPKTGSHEASGKAVQRPEGKAGEGVSGGRWKGDVLRSDEGFDMCGGFIKETDKEKVPEAARCGRQTRSCARRGTRLLTHRARSGVPNAESNGA